MYYEVIQEETIEVTNTPIMETVDKPIRFFIISILKVSNGFVYSPFMNRQNKKARTYTIIVHLRGLGLPDNETIK